MQPEAKEFRILSSRMFATELRKLEIRNLGAGIPCQHQ